MYESEFLDSAALTLREVLAIFPNQRDIKRLQISSAGTSEEIYNDPMTKSNGEYHIVHPIASNDSFFTYICPNCHRFHVHKRGLANYEPNDSAFHEWFPFPCDEFSFWMEKDDITGKYANMIEIVDKTGKHIQGKFNDIFEQYERRFL